MNFKAVRKNDFAEQPAKMGVQRARSITHNRQRDHAATKSPVAGPLSMKPSRNAAFYLPVTFPPLAEEETNPVIAQAKVRQAVASCDLSKARATAEARKLAGRMTRRAR